ncbi:MAG: hypothetical protein AAGC67_05880 [Myxococcota bacterium]
MSSSLETDRIFLLFVLCALAACGPPAAPLALSGPSPRQRVEGGIYVAADVRAAPVTLVNLPAKERFWPHQIRLVEDWKPEGWGGDFGWGMGVVIEVDRATRVRVDFSRFGKHWVPAHVTDIVARANRIRLGDAAKFKPNLVLALGNRLLDPTGRKLVETQVDLLDQHAFVLVYADPASDGFFDLVRALSPERHRAGVHFVLLPQGRLRDFEIWKACHEAGWWGSFLLDRFSPAYSEGFLDESGPLPRIEVRSPEGRRVWQGGPSDVAGLGAVFGR